MKLRVHLTGASGAGVTSIGQRLASMLGAPHFDTDDFYWAPTDPPFSEKRSIAVRRRLMEEVFIPAPRWVLSGSLDGWGDPFVPYFDAVVFVSTPKATRLDRLRRREALRLGEGAEAVEAIRQFLDWAAQYDGGGSSMRSRMRHEVWLGHLTCPVLRVDGSGDLGEICAEIVSELPKMG